MRIFSITIPALCLCLAACSSSVKSPAKPTKQYRVRGKVISLNPKDRSASIDAEAIPDYMEAMKMDYPIRDKAEFDGLRAGEEIAGTLDVFDSGDYSLHDIQPQSTK